MKSVFSWQQNVKREDFSRINFLKKDYMKSKDKFNIQRADLAFGWISYIKMPAKI